VASSDRTRSTFWQMAIVRSTELSPRAGVASHNIIANNGGTAAMLFHR